MRELAEIFALIRAGHLSDVVILGSHGRKSTEMVRGRWDFFECPDWNVQPPRDSTGSWMKSDLRDRSVFQ